MPAKIRGDLFDAKSELSHFSNPVEMLDMRWHTYDLGVVIIQLKFNIFLSAHPKEVYS